MIFNFSSPDCSLSVHTSITVYVLLHVKRGEQERLYIEMFLLLDEKWVTAWSRLIKYTTGTKDTS